MTLEDFEKALAKGDWDDEGRAVAPSSEKHSSREKRHHHHDDDRHRHKRSRHSRNDHEHRSKKHRRPSPSNQIDAGSERMANAERLRNSSASALSRSRSPLKRDTWMEGPPSLEFVFSQNRVAKGHEPEAKYVDSRLPTNKSSHSPRVDDENKMNDVVPEPENHTVNYTFGDAGAQWRMTKLKAVFREAGETHRPIDDVASERFGDLRAFDEAREEQIELDRRETYGKGYAWKEQPNGELFKARKRNTDPEDTTPRYSGDRQSPERSLPKFEETNVVQGANRVMDQTALNRLKAQMMKAKLRGAPTASKLEVEFNEAMTSFNNNREPTTVVLNPMESRLVTGGRRGEVKDVTTKRGRERGMVEENEAMSIEDMVKEERRTRNEAGGDGKRFAERIVKDGKFDVANRFSVPV